MVQLNSNLTLGRTCQPHMCLLLRLGLLLSLLVSSLLVHERVSDNLWQTTLVRHTKLYTGRNPKFPGQGNPMKCPGSLVHFLHQEILTFTWLFLVQYRAEFQAYVLNQDTWNFRHISCSQDIWHFKYIPFTFPVGTFWHKWKYLKAGQVTFHAHFLHTGNLVCRAHFLSTGKVSIIW